MASDLLNAAQLQRLERLEVLVEHLNAQLAERDAENAALRAELKGIPLVQCLRYSESCLQI